MNDRYQKISVVVGRFPASVLSDIVYGMAPMPQQLAESFRTLRLNHRLSYQDVMWCLCESDPEPGQCYGFGKALVELACQRLKDSDPGWK